MPIWGWWLIAILVGGVAGFMWTSQPDEGEAHSWNLQKFMAQLPRTTEKGDSIISDIVIDPPYMAEPIRDVKIRVQRVTFNVSARRIDTGKWEVTDRPSMVVNIPLFKKPPKPDFRITDYLDQERQRIPSLRYRKAWWKVSQLPPEMAATDRDVRWWQVTNHAWIVAIAISFVVIGLLWPMLIRVLVMLGLGMPEEGPSDLSGVRVAHAGVAEKTGETADDRAKLAALNAQLEASVGDMLLQSEERDHDAERRHEEQVIRQLSNQPVEAKTAEQLEQEAREFKGEFYPVARPVVKKED
jgi:hypothetical protein